VIVELISVGTEILLGNIVNTNASFLAEKCALLGLSLYYQTAVGDNPGRLEETLLTALNRSDVVILTGGLGPTQDDLTKEVAAKVMDRQLCLDEQRIQEYFGSRNVDLIPENNWKQAMVPENAIVIDNENGTAPGIIIEENGKSVILLPGPPDELVPMFMNDIYPYLNKLQPETIYSQMVKLCGIGESAAETMIQDLISEQTNPTVAPYAKIGEVHIRVTAKAKDEEEAKKLVKPVVKELKARFGKNVYSTDENETLEDAVVKLLEKNELTVTTAESCTGGMLAARLVNVAGVSEVFREGFITYSNKAKRKLLGVQKSTLKKYGAVSEKTVKEMAKGAALITDSDASLAVSGIAGPDGGTEEKPVGLVYIGCYVNDKVTVREFKFKGNRSKVREQSVVKALTLLRECIQDEYNN